MRTKHSVRNVAVGLISQVLIIAIGFISRRIFITALGYEMLGINGLLSSIISMLSLAELGIGTAVICNLYKPLADNDTDKITALVRFYAKAYRLIGTVLLLLGLGVVPFLRFLLNETMSRVFLSAVFLLFLADTVVSYFFAHKRSLIFADQRNYILTAVTTAGNITAGASQILILLLTRDYILYLSVKVVLKLAENVIIAAVANRRYPFIARRQSMPLETETRKNIISNTKSLALHHLGIYLINGTDNIIISKFLGLVVVGLYSNYLLIIATVNKVLSQFSTGVIASFGNMVAVEDAVKSYEIFRKANFINFIIYNFAVTSLLCLLNPFIILWVGSDSLLDMPVVIVLAANFYISGISSALSSIRAGAGIFRPDRYLHLVLAALNLAVSIGLVQVIGITGVFIGTLLCLLIKEVTVLPRIVFGRIFNLSVSRYYVSLIPYFMTSVLSSAAAFAVCNYLIASNGVLPFLLKLAACVIIPNTLILLLFGRTEEMKYVFSLLKVSFENIKRSKRKR